MNSTTRLATRWLGAFAAGALLMANASAQSAAPAKGAIQPGALQHNERSLAGVLSQAALVLPAAATGGAVFVGKWADAPTTKARVPVVVFLHGSSGLRLKAIADWQQWLASIGVASVAPDSFALADRATYSSPVDKDFYEKLHALRGSEISAALAGVKQAAWADTTRLVLAGTSEGAVAVARYTGKEFAARMIFSWSCEDNYFVESPKNAIDLDRPVLNIMSTVDPYFSQTNTWIGNAAAKGHCGDALKDHKRATIVLIPGAPHTLMTLPVARSVTAAFLQELTQR
ncbi:MAG TPA: dienelactone hydrolase family protein [Casimicrobium sp.]|mgnify:FL=1|nr:dienelactone hydrolase family protein [Casimicrobium sp.]